MASKNHVAFQKKRSLRLMEASNGANALKKGPWSPQEDALLIKYVTLEGERNWKNVQKTGLMRCGKSCRLRWTNHLHPELKKGNFSHEEEKIVIQMHQKVGNRWSKIAAELPGRTDNEVKNFWNTKIKKRMMSTSKTHEENFSPILQNCEVLNPSISPAMNSPTTLFSIQNSQMSLNSSTSSISPQSTFSITNSSELPRLSLLTNSTMHEDPMISFANDSSSTSNVFKSPSIKHILDANPFPGTHVLEFATGSTYYNPNPFPCAKTQMGSKCSIMLPPNLAKESMMQTNSFGYDLDVEMWNESLSYEHDQVSFVNTNNYYYDGLSIMEEATPEKDSMENEMESMDEELMSLVNSFSSDDSSPKLHVKNEGENSLSGYKIHYYLDQKLAFPSFSKANVTTSGSESPRSYSSDFNACFDVEDWIVQPEPC